MLSCKIDNFEGVKPYERVTVTMCGNVTEVKYNRRGGHACHIRRIDKDHYCDNRTGEVFEVQHKDSRIQDPKSVRASMCRLRQVINANTVTPRNCKWVTLTYAENMTDPERLYIDFKNFMKRFRYAYGECEYIIAIEPQERGAWHAHSLFIFSQKAPYVPNDRMAELWGHGWTKTRKLTNSMNVGLYLTTYLTDLEVTDGMKLSESAEVVRKEIENEDGKKESKRFIKGGRLHLYPAGFHFYRTSRRVAQPVTEKMSEEEARELVEDSKLTYEITRFIFDENDPNGFQTIVNIRYYTRRARKSRRERQRNPLHGGGMGGDTLPIIGPS